MASPAVHRRLTRREMWMGTLMVTIISSGAIGGALIRDDHQKQQKKADFVALPPNDQLSKLEEVREALIKNQLILERKLDEARMQRSMKERGSEIRENALAQQPKQPQKMADTVQSPSMVQSAEPSKSQQESIRSWKRWLQWP